MSWGELLDGAWAASLSAAVIILAVLPLRAMFRDRVPRRVFCLLWDAVLARLLVLTALPSPVSVWQWLPAVSPASAETGRTAVPGTAVPVTEIVAEGTAAASDLAAAPPVPVWDRSAVLAAVWLAVGLALAAWFLWSHLRSRRLYDDSLPCGDDLVRGWLASHRLRRNIQARTSDRVAAPLTYGVLRPVILLPSGMDWTDRASLSCILEHEYQHIRRFDTLRKALLAAALCLHWFDPLVWVLYVLSGRDMELACDETVTAQGADRAEYARTLLSMEEQRGRWGLSGSHFSQNALEERIRSIMEHKRISIAALIAVMAVMSITLAVFASAAPNSETGSRSGQDVPKTGYVYDHFRAVEGDVMILSQGGGDGERQYSVDGGRTWLSEEDYRAQYGNSDWQVEWWTAEDYSLWLEEEKQALQSIIGERGYTSGEGWFTWDQKRVDEAVALYESILENIRNGTLYSKTITDKSGDVVEDVMLGSGTLGGTAIFTYDEGNAVPPEPVDAEALLEELRAFGIGGDAGRMTYHGQPVRYLVDGVPVGDNGYSIPYVYSNPDGAVDVHTLRAVDRSPDGSYDPMGELTGVAAEGDPDFDRSLIESAAFSGGVQPATAEADVEDGSGTKSVPPEVIHGVEATAASGSSAEGGRTFEEIFARYQPYGLSYSPREGGRGSLTWNGQAVKSFADLKPDGGAFSYQDPYAETGSRVHTQYDAEGDLIGLRAG